MAKRNYEEEASRLSKAIDVAVDAFKKFPPPGFNDFHLEHFINLYLYWKNALSNPESQYKNLKSLQYQIEDAFTYFQESSGATVDYFWQQINELQLGYNRENKLDKILKRKKIKNDIEYNFIIDVIVPYQQENLITLDEVKLLNDLLAAYEANTIKPHKPF